MKSQTCFVWAGLTFLAACSLGCGSNSDSSAPVVAAEGGAAGGTDGGKPITGLTASKWTYVPIEGSLCRDGTGTGIGVNLGSNPDKLMIYLEGGGVCFDQITCSVMNPNHFDSSNFQTQVVGGEGSLGIFNRTDTSNPVADWTFVYIPYCTGDLFSGNNPNGNVPGVGPQKFVGYVDVGKDLERVVPTFPGVKQVLLTGVSAGGSGAGANYVQVANAFGSVPVYLLSDSGPNFENPYAPTCLQQEVATLWGSANGSLKDCEGMCTNPATYQLDFIRHIATKYPSVPMGLIESIQDQTLRQFYGFGTDNGTNDCMGGIATPEAADVFTAGLEDQAMKTKDLPNVGSFIFGDNGPPQSTQHTSLLTSLDTESTPASGVADSGAQVMLHDWVAQLIAGHITSVGLPPVTATDGGAQDGAGD